LTSDDDRGRAVGAANVWMPVWGPLDRPSTSGDDRAGQRRRRMTGGDPVGGSQRGRRGWRWRKG
jgi:hypothetical protein